MMSNTTKIIFVAIATDVINVFWCSEKSFVTWILEHCKIFAQRVESFEKLEECLGKLQLSCPSHEK